MGAESNVAPSLEALCGRMELLREDIIANLNLSAHYADMAIGFLTKPDGTIDRAGFGYAMRAHALYVEAANRGRDGLREVVKAIDRASKRPKVVERKSTK